LCYTVEAHADAYVTHDTNAPAGSQFSAVSNKGNHPITYVTWFGSVTYCNWLSAIDGLQDVYDPANDWSATITNNGYRLPTESEWYKAAAWDPNTQQYYAYGTSSDSIATNIANFANSGDPYEDQTIGTTPVGYYEYSSPYRLRDMSGNVSEWCHDLYAGTTPGVDPHVIKGGSWGQPAALGKASYRLALRPGEATSTVGFRVYNTLGVE
jgi:formylglycine-generating enzyme required for sulfatase activity